jgi:uncharacterized protein
MSREWNGQRGTAGVMETFTGRTFDLANPRAEYVNALDIAMGLARENRFGGHTREPYSVLTHSLLVAGIVGLRTHSPAAVIYALLHDAHEAYCKDIPRPLKHLLGEQYKQICASVQLAILDYHGLPLPSEEIAAAVKAADESACRAEARILMATEGAEWDWGDTEDIAMQEIVDVGEERFVKSFLQGLSNPKGFVEAAVLQPAFQPRAQFEYIELLVVEIGGVA